MRYFQPETAAKPFWKVEGKYVTLNDLALNPDIQINFPDGLDATLKDVVLHRLNSESFDREHTFGSTPIDGRGKQLTYDHEDLIRQVEDETEDGKYFMKIELETLTMLYDDLREGRWTVR